MTLREELESEGWAISGAHLEGMPVAIRLTRGRCSVFGLGNDMDEALANAREITRRVESFHSRHPEVQGE